MRRGSNWPQRRSLCRYALRPPTPHDSPSGKRTTRRPQSSLPNLTGSRNLQPLVRRSRSRCGRAADGVAGSSSAGRANAGHMLAIRDGSCERAPHAAPECTGRHAPELELHDTDPDPPLKRPRRETWSCLAAASSHRWARTEALNVTSGHIEASARGGSQDSSSEQVRRRARQEPRRLVATLASGSQERDHRPSKPGVAGSSPAGRANLFRFVPETAS